MSVDHYAGKCGLKDRRSFAWGMVRDDTNNAISRTF
jgi:hypothetical protein